MAYKFQLGSAILSGSTEFEEAVTVASLDTSGVVSSSADGRFLALDINGTEAISSARAGDLSSLALNSGGITDAGSIAGATTISGSGNASFGGTLSTSHGTFTVDADGDLSAKSLDARSGGISNAGAIAGASTISGSGVISGHELDIETSANIAGDIDSAGDLTAASITMTGVISGSNFFDMVKDKLRVDGVTVTSTAAELNLLDGVTATTTELNYVDVATPGTVEASKAVVVDSNKDAAGFRNLSASLEVAAFSLDLEGGANIAGDIDSAGDLTAASITMTGVVSGSGFFDMVKDKLRVDGVAVTSTAAELNLLDTAVAGTVVNSKAVIYGSSGEVNGTSVSGSGAVAGATIQVGGGTAVSNLAGAGLTISGGALTVDGASVTKLGDSDASLAVGVNVYDGAPPSNSNAYTLPSGSALSVGDVIRVKAGALQTNSVSASIRVQGTDKIEGVETELNLESNGAAVTIIYVDSDGKFVVF